MPVLVSLGLNLWNRDFPLAFHPDEPKKVEFVRDFTQDFKHPILMLQLVRAANSVAGFDGSEEIARLGRSVVAGCGALSVALVFWLSRSSLGPAWALVAAAGVAVSPILVVHAHYLKEDTLLTTCLLTSLLALARVVERNARRGVIALGMAAGLALASHYKALLLLPLGATAVFLYLPLGRPATHWRSRRSLAGALLVALTLAIVVFVAVNWPLLTDRATFRSGVSFEAEHVVRGHRDVRIDSRHFFWGFHLRHSLVPGMGWPAMALALCGLGLVAGRWRQATFRERLLASYVLILYFAHEATPLKPWPDFSRYMVPLVPVLVYFAVEALRHGVARAVGLAPVAGRSILLLGLCALVALPLLRSVRFVDALDSDTRVRAARWLAERGAPSIAESYASTTRDVKTATDVDLATARREGIRYLATSSFQYERFLVGGDLPGQRPEVYRSRDAYQALFRLPYLEITPEFESFAFSNPVIRIVDLGIEHGSP